MDSRVDIMGEIIGGMRVIKMYCWEKPFGEIVNAIRTKEVSKVTKLGTMSLFYYGMY